MEFATQISDSTNFYNNNLKLKQFATFAFFIEILFVNVSRMIWIRNLLFTNIKKYLKLILD